MADKLKAGSQSDFGGSMAEAIEQALNTVMQADGKPALPTEPRSVTDRRELFIAIAQGVIGHLAAHAAAFTITSDDPDNPTFAVTIQR